MSRELYFGCSFLFSVTIHSFDYYIFYILFIIILMNDTFLLFLVLFSDPLLFLFAFLIYFNILILIYFICGWLYPKQFPILIH